MMFEATTDRRAVHRRIAGVATAAALLLTGCASGGQGGQPAATATAGSEAAAEAEWDDPIWEAYGEEGEYVEEIDGVADDFPAQFPLPDGELVYSSVAPGVWDLIIETDEPEQQAEQLAERIGEIVPQVWNGPLRGGDEGERWGFADDDFVVALEMRPGPFPPPMVAITVLER
ncbi:hypothetical protein [Agromyces kandeliae]|uniref:Uncharacterized protein n=1 Tax=Agromyces kandeliae TaxID=2666141 RepID=A0A6L5QYK2_9MICO|nr:hypothetical protein [Agromyces kandeliae]MRX42733.1 hypothetical protein [Agromyces kandeliae]